ncbi:MAG: hypothetical protein R3C61_17785 [Bacteroidia bacterium]
MASQLPPAQPQGFVKQLTLLFVAIASGLVIFCGVAFYINQTQPIGSEELNGIFSVAAPAGSLLLAAVGYFALPAFLSRAPQTPYLQSKLGFYRTATIVRLAFWDAGGFICLVSYLLTGNNMYLAYLFPIVALFVLFSPNRDRVIQDLSLTSEEAKELS